MHSVRFGFPQAWWLVIFAIATCVSACQSPGTSRVVTPRVALTPVNISDPGNVAGAPFYIALDQGYFADEGLDVNFVTVTQTQAVASIATDQLQFAMSLPDVTLFNALARRRRRQDRRGHDCQSRTRTHRVVDDLQRPYRRRPLHIGGDLIGGSVGVSNETAQFYVERFLNQVGLSRTDVQFTMLTPPDIVAAFASGAIAAGWLPEPLATTAERQGVARPVATTGELLPGVTTQTLIMAPQLATNQSGVARRFCGPTCVASGRTTTPSTRATATAIW